MAAAAVTEAVADTREVRLAAEAPRPWAVPRPGVSLRAILRRWVVLPAILHAAHSRVVRRRRTVRSAHGRAVARPSKDRPLLAPGAVETPAPRPEIRCGQVAPSRPGCRAAAIDGTLLLKHSTWTPAATPEQGPSRRPAIDKATEAIALGDPTSGSQTDRAASPRSLVRTVAADRAPTFHKTAAGIGRRPTTRFAASGAARMSNPAIARSAQTMGRNCNPSNARATAAGT